MDAGVFFVISILIVPFWIFYLLVFKYPTSLECVYFDKHQQGLHVLTHRKHGNPDGDSFTEFYHHFLYLSNGRAFVSSSIQNNYNIDITLKELRKKTGVFLDPDYSLKPYKLKPNLWIISKDGYHIIIHLNKLHFGNSNIVECKKPGPLAYQYRWKV